MGGFDGLAKQVFSTISRTSLMGVSAIWHSSNNTDTAGQILFKNPTEVDPIGDVERYEYRPNQCTAEYHIDTFPGLKQLVDAGNEEYLIIDGLTYFIVEIQTKFDGKTMVAYIQPYQDGE